MKVTADLLLTRLEAELGPAAVQTDPQSLQSHVIDGLVPQAVCRPGDPAQVAAAVRICGETRAAVAPWGGGTTMALGNIPRGLDVVLALDRLNALIEHDDANLTATVQAGMTVAALQEQLRRGRQFLALDPPQPARATIGGVVAANTNGARRMFYGGVRDLVIGMQMVLPTGEQVKAGGKVVKNVAGYDMCKLFVGSLGTLGVISEVTFKMAPIPEAWATVVLQGLLGAAFRLVDDLFASTLQPAAIAVLNREAGAAAGLDVAPAAVAVAVEGFTEAVDRHVRDVTAMAGRAGLSAGVLRNQAHDALWAAIHDFPVPGEGEVLIRVTVPLASVAAAADAVRALAGDAGLPLVAHAGSGTMWLRAASGGARRLFGDACALAQSFRGHAVMAAAPAPVKRDLDVWGPPPPALAIMRKIKQRFDPHGLFNPGRFVAFL